MKVACALYTRAMSTPSNAAAMHPTPAHTDDWVDAQEMGRDHPGTFEAPTADELKGIRAGDFVKICNGEERFWAVVTVTNEADPIEGAFRGTVNNRLVGDNEYDFGDLLEFRGRHIYAIMPS